MRAELPTTLDSPADRLTSVHEAMIDAKGQFDLMPADALSEMSDLAPPALAMRAARLAARTRMADRTNPPANLIISNVPGPRTPLGLPGGAPLKHYYPVSTIVDGQGVNITVQSYVDTLDFGLVACRKLMPDVDVLADFIIDEISQMAKELGVKLKKPKKTVILRLFRARNNAFTETMNPITPWTAIVAYMKNRTASSEGSIAHKSE